MIERILRGTRIASCAALIALAASPPVAAQQAGEADAETSADTSGAALTVGTKAAPPFVMAGEGGEFSGISITLWQAVAERIGAEYTFASRDLKGLFTGLEDGDLDVSVAALTVTSEREADVDFSYPFYSTGLGIAVPASGSSLWSTLGRFFSWQFFTALAGLAAVLLLVGVAVWLFERRANPEEFGGGTAQGLGSGFWWAAVTMTTVGYGDKSPRTFGGRIVGLIWMFAAIIIISSFTAAIATSLTVDRLASDINGVQDLASARVATIADSAAAQTLSERGIAFSTREELEPALEALADNRLDAVVYDAPLLQYYIHDGYGDRLQVLDIVFDRQDYAFALPQGSELREPINRAILDYLAEDEWQDTLTRYLGAH